MKRVKINGLLKSVHRNYINDENMKRKLFLLAFAVIGISQSVRGQDVAVKTNVLADVFLSPSLGLEVGLAPKWTLDVKGQLNGWTVKGHYWKHWLVQPEARYWFCRRFSGHFVGAHLHGGQFNIGNIDLPFSFIGTNFRNLRDHRYQGWMGGAGLAYGYSWIISRHWNFEAEVGFGWVYTRFDRYPCASCGRKSAEGVPHHYVGPTKAALNFIYTF